MAPSASTFSDWWAYKIEAFDAIPFNAALLTQAGVQVCIKSDSEELIRHLYLEAAKMIKYGNVSEDQALAMITINPARELGLDRRLGSIEVGKDGDVAIFNAHPFDGFARCEIALIDGEVQFQRKSKEGKNAPRPGDHAANPAATLADAKGKPLDLSLAAGGTYAITGATLHPVSGAEIATARSSSAAARSAPSATPTWPCPPAAKVIDAAGLDVWPAWSTPARPSASRGSAASARPRTRPTPPSTSPSCGRASRSTPTARLIPVARANGVLATFVQPAGGVISGQGCVIGLDGWVPLEMVIQDKAGLVVNIPRYVAPNAEGRPRGAGGPGGGANADNPQARKDRLDAIKEQFKKAQAYDAVVVAARDRKRLPPAPTRGSPP